jgi:tetratricopeptide (TPR) repeat protein
LASCIRRLAIAAAAVAALSGGLPAPATAEVYGAYLAARAAMRAADFREAAGHFARILVHEPAHAGFLEGAMLAQIGQGSVAAAAPLARRLLALGVQNEAATLVLLAEQVAAGDFAPIPGDLADNRRIGPLPDALIRGWAEVGAGRMAAALAAFDRLAAMPGLRPFGLYHRALALALAGDFEGADATIAAEPGGFRTTRRGAIAHAQILSQIDRFAAAEAALEAVFGADRDPEIDPLRSALAAGRALPFDIVRSPAEGFAEAFYSLAAALEGEAGSKQALLYARLAQHLRPDHADAHLLAGELLFDLRQHALAIESYRRIPAADPRHFHGELARARVLAADRRAGEAETVLRGLLALHDDQVPAHVALGDLLRRERRFAEAAEAYGRAVARLGTPEPRHWGLFYSRGIAYERAGEWDRAEADFRTALWLYPDHPEVLNYLGYSLLEMNRDLEEALAMIERAMEQSPDAGHIVDSYAWGLFLLGRFEEAVAPMERAAKLLPVDPIVTDHLGDVYWAVGRKNEARFQWRRALSFGPEPELAERIRKKLDKGLDAVLAAEGATPLAERRR